MLKSLVVLVVNLVTIVVLIALSVWSVVLLLAVAVEPAGLHLSGVDGSTTDLLAAAAASTLSTIVIARLHSASTALLSSGEATER